MTPSMAWAATYKQASTWVKEKLPQPAPVLGASKILSAKTMRTVQGRSGENLYAAGQSKWDVVYKGVNLLTGNYSTSVTDLTFEGGYGIPVNVTRSYSANCSEEGPFGKGWSMSADVRSTAGGLMKSSGAPVRSVPVNFKERHSAQLNDPNATTADGTQVQPIQAVLASDAGGQEETIQRDADGILSTPPWDKNKVVSEFETIVKPDGTNWQIMKKNYVYTPEGTVYVYDKQGTYDGAGEVPMDQPAAIPEPSNVLKLTSATDRNGNVTTYTYGAGYVGFNKANGHTSEHPLTKVRMPNGHEINFVWGTGTTANRVIDVNDGVRHVTYGYTTYSGNPYLTSVTTPGGKQTTMTYQVPYTDSNWTPKEVAGPILRTITDPRGLTTTLYSSMRLGWLSPFNWGNIYALQPSVTTYRIVQPNTVEVWFDRDEGGAPSPTQVPNGFESGSLGAPQWGEYVSGPLGTQINHGYIRFLADANQVTIMTDMAEADMAGWSGSNLVWPGMCSWKVYDNDTQNLVAEHHSTRPYLMAQYAQLEDRKLKYSDLYQSWTDDTTSYNFLGNPLEKTHSVTKKLQDTSQTSESSAISFGYWGAEKYYQQKAVKDQGGRYAFTDYYDKDAAQGKKGMTFKVYDQARTTFYEDTSIAIPVSMPPCPTTKYWKYQLTPTDVNKYSAKFDYDSKGRAINAWKIQTTTPSYAYVQTHTAYGADTDGSWGQASQVVEDYGGINRTTSTLTYDSQGQAVTVQDAAGKVFHTTYNADGVITGIERIIGGASIPIVTFTYGLSGATNGLLLSVTDNMTGITKSMSYVASGVAICCPSAITETNGGDTYSTSYTYNSFGDRATSTYVTQSALGVSNTTKWQYSDYVQVGEPTNASRTFTTLTAIDPVSDSMLAEQFQYVFDTQGRMVEATYAMTPQSWTPTNGANYYDAAHRAASRGRTHYDYDASGRMKSVYNWWDTWNTGTGAYTSTPIRANECVYETTGLNRGLKTQNKFYNVVSGAWNLQRTEIYGYDANLDYLTSANYGDGLSNATPSWTYDAAGNRASDSTNPGTWTYDNLNRMTASPGATYTNDIVGNRLTKGSTTYTWDDLSRMTANVTSGTSSNFVYRSNGLRVQKESHTGSTNSNLVRYRYDGQMGIEDVELNSTNGGVSYSVSAITRFALGARGIDAISRTTLSGSMVSYPLYDTHGNSVGSLSKSGASWSISDEKTYDVWGGIRSGGSSDNKGRYCASLGHKQDDESGLVYMRARYYDSTSGRFLSQDSKRKSGNWFYYCTNNPVCKVDSDGKEDFFTDVIMIGAGFFSIMSATALGCGEYSLAIDLATIAIVAWAVYFAADQYTSFDSPLSSVASLGVKLFNGNFALTAIAKKLKWDPWLRGYLKASQAGLEAGQNSMARNCVVACFAYSLTLIGCLLAMENMD